MVFFTFAACASGDFESDEGPDSSLSAADATVATGGLALTNPTCGTGDGAAEDPCLDCTLAQCEAIYARCFGATFTTTLLGGVCDELGVCAADCACGGSDCFQSCLATAVVAGGTCDACLGELAQCEATSCSAACEAESDAGVDADPSRPDAAKP